VRAYAGRPRVVTIALVQMESSCTRLLNQLGLARAAERRQLVGSHRRRALPRRWERTSPVPVPAPGRRARRGVPLSLPGRHHSTRCRFACPALDPGLRLGALNQARHRNL